LRNVSISNFFFRSADVPVAETALAVAVWFYGYPKKSRRRSAAMSCKLLDQAPP
jgi:hypothetical protein